MYHELSRISGDPGREIVPPLAVDVFRGQLRHIARRYEPVELRALRARMAGRRPGEPIPVAITFDDDLRSHLELAAPELAAFGLPATFFLGTAWIDGPGWYWWQHLDACARRSPAAFDALRAGLARDWSWATERDIRWLANKIEALAPPERDAIMARIAELSPFEPEPGLDQDGIRALAGYGFEIGFHTRGHYSLPTLDAIALRHQLKDGTQELARLAGARPTSIAYPHCRADSRVAKAATEAGFEIGVICSTGPASANQDPLLLDRLNAWTPSVASFALNLARATIPCS